MTSSPTVLIIGCGVAGPVLAVLLQQRGYAPIVFEKVGVLGEAGASLLLQPNGMKVLGMLGVAEGLEEEFRPLAGYWHGTAQGQTLADSELASGFKERYGYSAVGIRRSELNLRLKKLLLDREIEVREGWELLTIQESGDFVTATFSNGRSATGSFLVGCDGIKAATRRVILQMNSDSIEGPPVFTGLTQTAGISPTPSTLENRGGKMCNWYGEGIHVIAYPISKTHVSWAVTLPDSNKQPETWRLSTAEELESRRSELLACLGGFEPAVLQLTRDAERIIKYGLFDREELTAEQWHSKRCVLVGDAAHPTSPHIGQGANQALEDCYHLSRLLPDLQLGLGAEERDSALRGVDLSAVFRTFAEKRQPRTSMLVRDARRQGELRVVTDGPAKCRERDGRIAAAWENTAAMMDNFDRLLQEPF
ncbi:FAD-dependent oxidoreductase [Aspergillus homomorphus CBS 101889]|uniref:FAD/NAD(P)-binding domain-containing protein n=1 Tax=Aspergillus homomorphus (strain CBS 101889) TaxID=1450537 RepID=A0A395HHP4_ASPHC|nr:FAD/NAD(P)-binding domain-containing protein [Aspergillus homomorphus CBS 101889]RAL07146.1 FAD/NAD(P)-binding domain-containing protein [Aspergillus homomorphus CBS 101889]